jgi:hypothetical protein
MEEDGDHGMISRKRRCSFDEEKKTYPCTDMKEASILRKKKDLSGQGHDLHLLEVSRWKKSYLTRVFQIAPGVQSIVQSKTSKKMR